MNIQIDRKLSTDVCRLGYLSIDGTPTCYTLERPDQNNQAPFASIAAGTYPGHVRIDGHLGWRIALSNVPGHTNIEIHVGNYPSNTQGCILVGLGVDANNCVVTSSQAARDQIESAFQTANLFDDFDISIQVTDDGSELLSGLVGGVAS